jgi:hypothetical protein
MSVTQANFTFRKDLTELGKRLGLKGTCFRSQKQSKISTFYVYPFKCFTDGAVFFYHIWGPISSNG